jgi:peptide-methionine (S)-S-oxide reductase
MINPWEALPGRRERMSAAGTHLVLGSALAPPFPSGFATAVFGMGCFWGAERRFWEMRGVFSTAVGYTAGHTPNPTYEEVCTGRTGHAEVVQVVFDPTKISYERLLGVFWDSHNPTQGMRQGDDVGTQYRSGVYTSGAAQEQAANRSRDEYQRTLKAAGFGEITTEILALPEFYYAEARHQQYLAKNPGRSCNLHGCPITRGVRAS